MALLALQWGGDRYPWKSATIIGLFVGFFLLIAVFILWQIYRQDSAMIPPRLMMQRTILAVSFASFFAMGTAITVIYFLPEWFQVIRGVTPTKSGLMYLAVALAEILAANISGGSVALFGYYNPFILMGTILMAVSCGLFTTFQRDTSHQRWIPYEVIQGLGTGMTVAMPSIAAQAVLEPKDIPVGNSIILLFQFFGASVILAISQAIFSNKLVSGLSKLQSSGLSPHDIQRILKAGSGAVRSVVTQQQLPAVLEVFNHAITSTFYVAAATSTAAFVASLFLQWKSLKGKSLLPVG